MDKDLLKNPRPAPETHLPNDQKTPASAAPVTPSSANKTITHKYGLLSNSKRLFTRLVTLPLKRWIEGVVLKSELRRLYMVFGGHIFFQTMRTAVQLDLFTVLAEEGKMTRAQIAKRLNLAEQPVRILLLGLVACGLLKKRGQYYRNSYSARVLLDSNSPRKITAYVELQHQAMYKGLFWMLESVQQYTNVGLKEFPGIEPTLYERLAHNPSLEKVFQDAMQELSVQANSGLAKFVDLSDIKQIVDVGGGDGTNLITLAEQWPHIKGSVFDSPTVCKIAEDRIARHHLADRLDVRPGDCFTTPFPKDADCLLFCHFFTIWGEEMDRALLKKAYDSLPSGGKVIIFNMMQNNDETGPLSAAVGSPYFLSLATGKGMLYTWNEYETWMREAGFSDVKCHKLLRDHGAIVATKA